MNNKMIAHKKTYRKQQVKTYLTKLWYIPIAIGYLIKGLSLIVLFVFGWFAMNRMKGIVNNSNQKLMIQREQYKPIKKEHKLNKKQAKKELIKEEENGKKSV